MTKRRGQRSEPERIWTNWNFTKLRTLFECPLRFWFAYVEKVGAPQPPLFVAGSALHWMAKRFFAVRFRSKETFSNTWKRHWRAVCDGEYGPDGKHDKPVKIAWSYPEERWVWRSRGIEACSSFYERYAPLWGTPGLAVCRERRLTFDWMGFSFTVKVDRIDIIDDEGAVRPVDYKYGKHPDVLAGSIEEYQPILYGLAYEECLRHQHFGGKSIKAFRIESLQTGNTFDLKPATASDLDRLFKLVRFASAYVQGTLTGELPAGFPFDNEYFFRIEELREGLERRMLVPRLPRDKRAHCSMCTFIPDCIGWERAEVKPSGALDWIKHLERVRQAEYPGQAELVFDV